MVLVLSTWESSRRGAGRVAVRLERTSFRCMYQRHCGNAGARITGGRTSGIVKCCPRGSTQERAPPLGNQPENWWAEWRSFVSGIPVVFFNAAGALEQVSQELYTVSAWLVLRLAWLDFVLAVSEVVSTIALFFFLPSPFPLSSLVSSDLPGSEGLESLRLAYFILPPRSSLSRLLHGSRCHRAGFRP